jgi:hypothetical protein
MDSNEEIYETSPEIKEVMERVEFINKNLPNLLSIGDHRTMIMWTIERSKSENRIRAAWAAWRFKGEPSTKDGVTRYTVVRGTVPPEECHYFKYGAVDYHETALSCPEDPASYSLEHGKLGVGWACWNALPDKYRISERGMLYQCVRWAATNRPTQDELLAWIKGKRPDDERCNEFMCDYILATAEECFVKGLNREQN